METIKLGSNGAQVKRWQYFLIGLNNNQIIADGDFGSKTHAATVKFQLDNHLVGDGIVGSKSYFAAFLAGYRLKEAFDFPSKPSFKPLVGNSARARIFGNFNFKSAGDGTEAIIITDGWADRNIVRPEIIQLKGIKGVPQSTKIQFHKLGAEQLKSLFIDWEEAGYIKNILSWEGSFVPRYIRGSRRTLSNHSFGTAFDINYAWNKLGQVPALIGEKGSVREMVEIANKNGFYWGGHFSRMDGMHFEVAVLK
ncbi:MAG: M15 family metallopeptidase [Saprospiraceae bacterium]|nr:M15 family metallopeptidase [Saprospiraceae bacterium]MCF8250164.1 M15 family metallopeptidase [Saprospiraceae bacterium]MCF8279427.1 M15 family metallopeptidase [Bacteroidales bacterium]MCF8311218.1 M15 family metallopeptidase [Saprospiraceae bacterium]MCF8440402.1 M15 family metallopeptidase [Saprospiraceae bacterium]